MTISKNYQNFIGCDKAYDEANIVIFGAPYDGTTSYRPGTRFAAKAMRAESILGFETYSPYQDKDLTEISVFDYGDLVLPYGGPHLILDIISDFTRDVLSDNKIPVMIGGEHLVTLGTVRALVEKYPDLHVIHFDAHTDLRHEFFGKELSHATVIRRVWDLVGDGKIFQMGIRSGDRSEFEWAKEHLHQNRYNCDTIDYIIEQTKGKPVYVTIDLDVLDPSVFPGTGTPEPGGIEFSTLLNCILKMSELNIVGADINELSPHYDPSGSSTAVAIKTLRELLLVIEK
ncbi:agmatinase [Proteiniborus sp. MB09-C3]|uniref:agmatinase n=1 Tax=Proteiniborus sp. MB09-C3 TaxID=3050072 RepID=UPI002555A507|nr:agmatinase [Proteiniborus sp. MB09-C3]WIV11850.1 agmatinase [Proteiniborus sp. MB09-C3]